MRPTTAVSIDPVTFAVIWGAIEAIPEEMGINLRRSAYSEGIREGRDFSAALFDGRGRMIAQGNFSPGHLGSMPEMVRHVTNAYPISGMAPGDVFLSNDLYMGSGHLPDCFATSPIFWSDEVIGFAVTCGHMVDVGGTGPGSQAVHVTDFYQEGLRLLPTRLYHAGEPNREVMRIIEANVRIPDKVIGDLKALRNANRLGAVRVQELLKRYGRETVELCWAGILDHSEAAMRRAIGAIPDGQYTAEDFYDDCGEGTDPLRVRVTVVVRDTDITLDYTGSSAQTRSGFNALLNYTKAWSYFAVKAVTVRDEVPQNAGCIRPIHVTAPEGSLFNPRPPAAGGARPIMQQRILDAIFSALQGVLPNRIIANSAQWANPIYGGVDPRTDKPFVFYEIIIGGTGARPIRDGSEGLSSAFNLENIPVEINEAHYPIVVEHLGYETDTGGAGRFRGGTALRKDVRVLGRDVVFSNLTDRQRFAPQGYLGGYGGPPGVTVVNADGPTPRRLHSKGIYDLQTADLVRIVTSGTGGFGDPLERDARAVAVDVRDGFVTLEAACERYGVVVIPGTWIVDEDATARLRRSKKDGADAGRPVEPDR